MAMIAAVFGAEVPRDAGDFFHRNVREFISEFVEGDVVIFEQPWMVINFSKRFPDAKFAVYCFESVWPKLSDSHRWIAAINCADLFIFELPPKTMDDEFGYRHSIIDQAITAISLKREFKTTDPTLLANLIAKRLKESSATASRT